MTSSQKKFRKRFLRGAIVAIIVYLTFSVLTTKIIHDFVFQRYEADSVSGVLTDIQGTRTGFSYPCGDHSLTGSLYSNHGEYGLIVLAPGFKAESAEYESVICALLQEGFDVFAFDATGHGESEGETSVGFPQIIADIDSTLAFIKTNEEIQYKNVFLLGHSRGGYGVCCTMNSHEGIAAVVSVNGVDTAMDAIMAYSTKYVGGLAYGNYPFLSLYQNLIFGAEVSGRSAIAEIAESSVPVLIVQADADEVISKDQFSVYSKKEQLKSERAEFLLYDKVGNNGHVSALYREDGKANLDLIQTIAKFYRMNSLE